MRFQLYRTGRTLDPKDGVVAILEADNWDDFGFKTSFKLQLLSKSTGKVDIGYVSIAYEDMGFGWTRDSIDRTFNQLPENFYSVGTSDEYYWNLKKFSSETMKDVLSGLRDLALDLDRFESLLQNKDRNRVLFDSLLRNNKADLIRGQYHRIATGGVRFSEFSMEVPVQFENANSIGFSVKPESRPPSNVHAIIGSNGVGKTYFLSELFSKAIAEKGEIQFSSRENGVALLSVVRVAFSPFESDEFINSQVDETLPRKPTYTQIGIAKKDSSENKNGSDLKKDFAHFVEKSVRSGKANWLQVAFSRLEADPILSSNEAYLLASQAKEINPAQLADEFSRLSSGHKVVLLCLAGLAAEVDEGTLVLIDEPENHLHPPLLSSFIRAVSELLLERNGLAVVGTHSPVVLQEIPKDCVWLMSRSGETSKAERPLIETFGENVGVLTREVFGLQVGESGFYRMLSDAVDEHGAYQGVVDAFGGELGGEAKALIRVLLAAKE